MGVHLDLNGGNDCPVVDQRDLIRYRNYLRCKSHALPIEPEGQESFIFKPEPLGESVGGSSSACLLSRAVN